MKTLASCLGYIFCKCNTPVLTVLLGLTMCCSSAIAQSGAGSIQGTVTDSSGAVIAGASIHVLQIGTNASFDTKSNGVGFYQVPFRKVWKLDCSSCWICSRPYAG